MSYSYLSWEKREEKGSTKKKKRTLLLNTLENVSEQIFFSREVNLLW